MKRKEKILTQPINPASKQLFDKYLSSNYTKMDLVNTNWKQVYSNKTNYEVHLIKLKRKIFKLHPDIFNKELDKENLHFEIFNISYLQIIKRIENPLNKTLPALNLDTIENYFGMVLDMSLKQYINKNKKNNDSGVVLIYNIDTYDNKDISTFNDFERKENIQENAEILVKVINYMKNNLNANEFLIFNSYYLNKMSLKKITKEFNMQYETVKYLSLIIKNKIKQYSDENKKRK